MKKDFINLDNISREDLKKILYFGKSSKESYLKDIDKVFQNSSKVVAVHFMPKRAPKS